MKISGQNVIVTVQLNTNGLCSPEGMPEARPELRWKQVRILHGPATVMKELCSLCHCIQVCNDRQGMWEGERGVDSESGNMHETDFGSQASEKRKVEFLFAKNSENGLWQGG